MRIAIGADHAGYELKDHLGRLLAEAGHEIDDVGTDATSFFDALSVNDVVEVKDVEPNGSAEELELED